MKILFCLGLGLAVGCVAGMIGIGGGVLLIPALTALLGDQRKAAALTLAAMVPPVTLPSVWQYYKYGHLQRLDLVFAVSISVAFALGGFLGARLQQQLSLDTLRLLFGLLLLYVAVRTILGSTSETRRTVAGLTTVGLAWLAHYWLRTLGRKHLTRPDLGDHIRKSDAGPPPGSDYCI